MSSGQLEYLSPHHDPPTILIKNMIAIANEGHIHSRIVLNRAVPNLEIFWIWAKGKHSTISHTHEKIKPDYQQKSFIGEQDLVSNLV